VDVSAPDPNDDRSTITLRADRAIVDDAMKRTELWQMLRELAGVETPFTAKIRQEAESRSQAAIDQERSSFEHEKSQALADFQMNADRQAVERVRDHLLEMAGFITTPQRDEAGAGSGDTAENGRENGS
jgi:hypothetical protein